MKTNKNRYQVIQNLFSHTNVAKRTDKIQSVCKNHFWKIAKR